MTVPRRVALLLLLAAACGKPVPKPEAMDPATADEAAAFAAAFEPAFENCDGAALAELFDLESIIRRSTHGSTVMKSAEREAAYKQLQLERADIPKSLCSTRPDEHLALTLLRIRDDAGRPTPVFRVRRAAGVNYYELELGKSRRDGKVRLVDLYVYLSGERLTDTYANLFGDAAVSMRSGGRIDLRPVSAALDRGDGVEARRLIAALPQRVRESKSLRLMELRAVKPEDPAYLEVVESIERAFPGDPAIDMVSIDGYFLRKDLPRVLAVLDRVDRKVGGDPYLSVLRVGAYMLDPTPENLAAAAAAASAGLAAAPDLQEVHFARLAVQVKRGQYPDALASIDELERRFNTTFDPAAMAEDPAWQPFNASPEMKAWRAARGTNGPR